MNRREFVSAGASAALAIGAIPQRSPGSERPRPTPQQLAWQRAELGDRASGDSHGETLSLFGTSQHGGDVVTQLALGYNGQGSTVAELL